MQENNFLENKYDVLIIGAGLAGLYAAMNIPKEKNVLVVCKDIPWECNTFYAQGGMVTALNEADIPSHVEDTMAAGSYHNKKEAVEILSQTSLETTKDIIDRGMEFDTDEDGNILYTKEAAHSIERIIHAGGDATGRYMHYFMMVQNKHMLQKNTLVYDLLIDQGRCYGVKATVNYEPTTIYADDVIIASGGIGSLYEYNTNSRTVSADIHGICVEKGIALADMEFMQFHPTVFVDTPYARKLLLTEALRGEGAHVVDEDGRRFLFDYDARGELASRDIVSRGIFDYRRKTGKQAYLDFSMFEAEWFEHRFPNITRTFGTLGYHFPKDRAPISPAFHYANGGIECDTNGAISGMKGLYVIGEAACTGVHGANRLASNSLLEGVVFAKRVVTHLLAKETEEIEIPTFEKDYGNILHKENDEIYKQKLRQVMWDDIGIIRTTQGLLEAKNLIYDMKNHDIGRLLQLRLNTASAIVDAALSRTESLGSHYIES
ncbi:MAG: L-aspartate oxidase (EC [uncultured Sulfurovum sp.]|uniref:L-aspartate oxidase n=1 Tax=uncultured Sulfurovum sp. TaxID=269237 RepID=A0A6S6TVZ3_9BACT|nr:MAG: L-aspartate oxidase (EC [uncultured Sulfurovum sp.]